jgi:hypothetical protein
MGERFVNDINFENCRMVKYIICIIIAFILLPLFIVLACMIGIRLGLSETEMSDRLLIFLVLLCVFLCSLVILLPLSFLKVTHVLAGYGFYTTSFVCGISGWYMGCPLCGEVWGPLAVIIGLLILGIGVVPIAMLATLFNGMWIELGLLVLAVVMTLGFRFIGINFVEEIREKNEKQKIQLEAFAELKLYSSGLLGILVS